MMAFWRDKSSNTCDQTGCLSPKIVKNRRILEKCETFHTFKFAHFENQKSAPHILCFGTDRVRSAYSINEAFRRQFCADKNACQTVYRRSIYTGFFESDKMLNSMYEKVAFAAANKYNNRDIQPQKSDFWGKLTNFRGKI